MVEFPTEAIPMGIRTSRLRHALAEPVFAALLVAIGFALLGWPFVEAVRDGGEGALFRYYFLVWGGLVALAALLAWAVGGRDSDV